MIKSTLTASNWAIAKQNIPLENEVTVTGDFMMQDAGDWAITYDKHIETVLCSSQTAHNILTGAILDYPKCGEYAKAKALLLYVYSHRYWVAGWGLSKTPPKSKTEIAKRKDAGPSYWPTAKYFHTDDDNWDVMYTLCDKLFGDEDNDDDLDMIMSEALKIQKGLQVEEDNVLSSETIRKYYMGRLADM